MAVNHMSAKMTEAFKKSVHAWGRTQVMQYVSVTDSIGKVDKNLHGVLRMKIEGEIRLIEREIGKNPSWVMVELRSQKRMLERFLGVASETKPEPHKPEL